jgi:hypothetical protein
MGKMSSSNANLSIHNVLSLIWPIMGEWLLCYKHIRGSIWVRVFFIFMLATTHMPQDTTMATYCSLLWCMAIQSFT